MGFEFWIFGLVVIILLGKIASDVQAIYQRITRDDRVSRDDDLGL
jgi:hypothetical protein